jgi:hypothetical protein
MSCRLSIANLVLRASHTCLNRLCCSQLHEGVVGILHRQNLPDVDTAAGHRDPCAASAIVHVDAATSPASPPRIAPHGKRSQYSALLSVDARDTDVACGAQAWLLVTKWGVKRNPTQVCLRSWTSPSKRNGVPWRHSPPLPPLQCQRTVT